MSVGGAIGLGFLLNNFAAGFFIVAGLYLILTVVIYYNRQNWIRNPIMNTIVKSIYENE
jgi:hypothetical protein